MGGHLQFGRRQFLQSASALGLGAGLGSWEVLRGITPAHAADLRVGPDAVQFRPEIEPVVRWIEETPQDRALEVAIGHLKDGLAYRDLLAGLFLAGIRNVKPRPVGFKFHAVMVMNSAHLLGQTAAVPDRLLPMLWALDTFKKSQAQDIKEGDWTLNKVDEARLPRPDRAKAEFIRAMDNWDADAADVAIAALCRTAGAAEVMEPLYRFGIRDQRNIGHKAIFTAQCWRTLQAIGWQHAEPVLRSLTYGQLDLMNDSRPIAVGPYEANLENARKIRDDWQTGKPDPSATRALLETLRQASSEGASSEAVAILNRGIAPESLWDAVILAANETLMRAPGILALHAVTSANALHFIFGASGDDTTRRLALLQAVGWQPMFRGRIKPGEGLAIDALEPKAPETQGAEAVGDIFATIDKSVESKGAAAAKAVGYLNAGGSTDVLFEAARRMIFHKGRDSHDYKYGAAAWEECVLASDPRWRAPLAAAMMFNLPGSKTPDSPLMNQARAAIARVLG
jgi:hypothetical protein